MFMVYSIYGSRKAIYGRLNCASGSRTEDRTVLVGAALKVPIANNINHHMKINFNKQVIKIEEIIENLRNLFSSVLFFTDNLMYEIVHTFSYEHA